MNWFIIAIAAVGVVLVSDGGDPAAKKEFDKMQGTWLVVKQVADGRDATDKELKEADIKLVVKGSNYTVVFGGKVLTEGKLKVDSAKNPLQLDATDDEGSLKGQSRPAVYKFEKDLWIVNFGKPGQARPTDFTNIQGSNRLMLTYQKQKVK